ncbi:RNA polymerase [Naviculisporaceae sp. PSN 640]
MTTLTPVPRRQTGAPPSSAPSSMSTIKPILKTKSILGTRSRSDDDNGDELHSSPIKKRKTVIINEDLNMVKNIGSKSLDDAKRDIKRALEGHKRGKKEDYEKIIELFASSKSPSQSQNSKDDEETDDDDEDDDDDDDDSHTPKAQDLFVYVLALTSQVTLLGRNCHGLVKAVLQCAWLDRDEDFSKAYTQLLAALSSAQASFFTQVLSMMVGKFNVAKGGGPQKVPGYPPVDSETRKSRLHVGLRYLLDLFPAGKRIILDLIGQTFPYSDDSKAVHLEYIDHLLRLKEQRPELERDVMELILSRLVKLDVEMSLDLENDDDETTRAVLRQLEAAQSPSDEGVSAKGSGDADGEETDAESEAESVISDDDDDDPESRDAQTKRVLLIKSKAETMDAILDLLFQLYSPIFENPDSPKAVETFENMLSDFANVILPHLKSRHTQYLLFKFALKSEKLQDMFIGTLFNLAFESSRQPIQKQAAVGYLASFTARGAKLTTEQIQTVAQTFLLYINHYRDSHKNCLGPDVRKYTQYYAYFQGLLYIFCFRWRDLIDRDALPRTVEWDDPASFVGQDLPWMDGLRTVLQENILCKLNPLKCCSPVIVEEFASLSRHLGLLYIYPQLEKNKNIQLSQFFYGSYANGGALRDSGFEHITGSFLEPCFPFDPFQLPVSKRWLELDTNYVSWQHLALLNPNDDESELEHDGLESEVDDTTTDDGNHD